MRMRKHKNVKRTYWISFTPIGSDRSLRFYKPLKLQKLHAETQDEAVRELLSDRLMKTTNFTIWRYPGANLIYAQ
jgi:hypothetical protein